MKPPPANMDPSPPPAPEYIPVCNKTNAPPKKKKETKVLKGKRRKSRASKKRHKPKEKGRRQIDSSARKAHRNPENKHKRLRSKARRSQEERLTKGGRTKYRPLGNNSNRRFFTMY